MPGPKFLEGDRLSLHIVEPEDHAFIHRSWMDLGRETEQISNQWTEETIEEWVSDDDAHHFVVCRDGTRVGHALLQDIHWKYRRGEIGYLIAGEHQGKGYATEAADLILTHAFDELGLHKVWAKGQDPNEASKRVLEKLGFTQEGVIRDQFYVFGDYVDGFRYGLLESER